MVLSVEVEGGRRGLRGKKEELGSPYRSFEGRTTKAWKGQRCPRATRNIDRRPGSYESEQVSRGFELVDRTSARGRGRTC